MKYLSGVLSRNYILILLVVITLTNLNCHVQLIAKYDQPAVDNIIHVYTEVNDFYNDLSNAPADQRKYQIFSKRMNSIETEIGVMVLQNSARPLNSESTKIASNILDSWRKHENQFQKENNYPDGLITFDRNTFFNNFKEMLTAEQAKPKTD